MLLEKIEKEISAKNTEKELRIKKENELFQKEIDKLTLLLKDLEILKQYGFNPTLHTDKSHCPCPAIHIRNLGDYTSFYISKDSSIRADHHNSPKAFENKELFFDFIAKEVANRKVK